MGCHERKLHKHHTGLLTTRQVTNRECVCVTLQAILAQLVAYTLVGLFVEQTAQIGDRVLVHRKALHEVLVVHAHTETRIAADLSLRRLQFVSNQLDNCTIQ